MLTGEMTITGLSPPTRGSPHPRSPSHPTAGSIPAHAGEPRARGLPAPGIRVYPRPRGGAVIRFVLPWAEKGLSPPTRGSRPQRRFTERDVRSIPAHAGEPRRLLLPRRTSGVYPRPRGGAGLFVSVRCHSRGLSPPTRGSRRRCRGHAVVQGSIPAHAGEPAAGAVRVAFEGVYPRPRGGAQG